MADPSVAGAQPDASSASRSVGRILAALFVIAVTAVFTVFANLILTFLFWKAAIGLNVLVIAFGVLLWSARGFTRFWRYVLIATVVAAVVPSVWIFRTTWTSHSRHDGRLAEMVATLCAVDLPSGATLEDCGGSITNTGNGNSCRYLATAVVRSDADLSTVTNELEAQGFDPTDLDQFGEPIDDGPAYTLVEGDELRLSLQASWQPQEGDLRCT